MISKSAFIAIVVCLSIVACSKNEGASSSNSPPVTSGKSIPSHWTKRESKDAMTDQIKKLYDTPSKESSSYGLTVGCSKGGFLNFYVEYPVRTGIPAQTMEVGVRVDSDPPFTESWFVSWSTGATVINEPYNFLQKIKGKSQLTVEIIGAAKNTFNIAGIEQVVADMEATACPFENKNINKQLQIADMPKFAAACSASNIPTRILITEPEKQRIFFSRMDHQYDPGIGTKVNIFEKSIEATIETPCCKDAARKLTFNRQTGELTEGNLKFQCEKLADDAYAAELEASIQHYERKLKEVEDKQAAQKAAVDQARQEQINKANSPNKF